MGFLQLTSAGAPAGLSDLTSSVTIAQLLKDQTKLKQLSDGLFSFTDKDKSGGVDRAEITETFKVLKKLNIIPRLPNAAEVKKIEKVAGDDQILTPTEFQLVVKGTVETIAGASDVAKSVNGAELLQDDKKLSEFSSTLFQKVDADSNGGVDRAEATVAFKD